MIGSSRRLAVGQREVAAGAALAMALIGLGGWRYWQTWPEQHLAMAGSLLDEGRPGAAEVWLALPEATPRTRDRALLLRARAALARSRPAEAVASLNQIGPDGPCASEAAF